MIAAGTFVVVLLLSLIVVRVATVALRVTGMSVEAARFQVRSAWTGTGFTTSESEQVVSHPARRRIVTWLMILRGAGVASAAGTLLLSLGGAQRSEQVALRLGVLVLGLVVVWLLSLSKRVDRWLTGVISWVLRRTTDLDVRDYSSLFHLAGEFGVSELHVETGDWMAGRTLAELDMPDEGVLVLAVNKPGGVFIGAPRGRTRLEGGDNIIIYGRSSVLEGLDKRRLTPEGDAEHRRAIMEQKRLEHEEAERAEAAERGRRRAVEAGEQERGSGDGA